jgi:formamidopyrimidine-DNA glycosylase
MPELPEVETIRQGLRQNILGQNIIAIEVKKKNIVKNPKKYFVDFLQNQHFVEVSRVGKLLIFHLQNKNYFLLIHLKMTGQLIFQDKTQTLAGGHSGPKITDLPNKYSHVIFHFASDVKLFFNDLRQFGYLKIVDQKDKEKIVAQFGIEPLQANFTYQNFLKIFQKRRIALKAVLLNQKLIAGLGNIYVDEVCHQAGVLPQRLVNTLTELEIKKLFKASQKIIKLAIAKRGTTFSDYRDTEGKAGNFSDYLKVYGRGGELCLTCGQNKLKKIKLNGRGTTFCEQCQK